MPQFMLLLYNEPSVMRNLSPEQMQKALEKYMAWTKLSVDSKRLAGDPGKVLRATNGAAPRATDGPYSETKEMLGGYYAIEAKDYDDAVAKAMTHPHLEFGGTIEVRAVFSM